MNSPSHDKHFRVQSPARAYGVLIALSGLLLAVGLALPLGFASTASSDTAHGSSNNGPIDAGNGVTGATPSSTASTDFDKIPDTAQGVTATSIKLGVVLLDLSSVAPLGLGLPNFSTDLQQAEYDSLFKQINDAGGINGRTIDPVYVSRDTLATSGPHSDHAICVDLAKDEQVFAVIGTTYAAGECAATQYHLPVISNGGSLQQVYQDSDNLLVTLAPSLERDAENWATVLVQSGLAVDHKVGMVTTADGSTYQLPAEAASAKLAALGHPLTVMGQLDPSNSLADIPPLIQKMKSSGVDSVMLLTDFADALRFIALAETQHFYPQYLTSDADSLATDGLLAQASKSFDGAIGFSDVHPASQPETPQETACREGYNENTTQPDVPAGVQNALGIMCSEVAIFKKAATDAGADLNPRSFIEALENIGTLDDVSAVLPGSFGPGKTDYSDTLQPVRWSSAKKSYSVDGDPIALGP